MGLTTSLYTALTGLNANSQAISIAGNNIANANTTGFKGSRADFDTQILQNFGNGTAPTAERGGSNPVQIGLGTRLAGTTRNLQNGTIQLTGINTDLSVEGGGFFVLDLDGNRFYTRDGSFGLDTDQKLVNAAGGRVQGYGIDSDFNVVEGVLSDISIPLGTLTIAEATSQANFTGNLNAGGDAATVGSLINSGVLFSDAGGVNQALAGDLLSSIFNGSGTQLFSDGDIITISGVTKGGATLPDKTFEVGAANTTGSDDNGETMQDFFDFLEDAFGIDTSVGGGVSLNGGQLTIEGNTGVVNDLVIDSDNIIVNQTTNPTLPFTLDKTQDADGESVRTTFVLYDSLGVEMVVDMSIVLEGKSNSGTQWRFYAQSEDDSDLDRVLGNGTLSFDTSGRFLSATDTSLTIDREGTGALTPQAINFSFDAPEQSVSALADDESEITMSSQDGTPIGTLDDFSVTESGMIVGVFSNGLLRNLGQVVLANFVNPEGLSESAGNLFEETSSSGNAAIHTPGGGGTGRIIGQSLELSNVDLSQEFINLITATTGFTANSRVFTTSDRLVQELLSSLR